MSEYEYLGVFLEKVLSWNAHVKYVLSKAGKRVGMLTRMRCNVTTNTANMFYKSFILPVLDQSDRVWDSCWPVNSDLIETLHRKAALFIVKAAPH